MKSEQTETVGLAASVRINSPAIVCYRDVNFPGFLSDPDPNTSRARMLRDIRQRFLQDLEA